MTIHPVRLNGMVIGVPQTYDYFAKTQERIVGFVTAHCHISRQQLEEYMLRTGEMANDVGSILMAQEAVACGLMDGIGTLSDALAWLHGQT
jgi:ATP-dependent protease ClpP protease subunit